MSDTTTKTSGGIGFFGLLGVAFIVLKLCKVIDWSWWFILMPIYLPIVFVIILYIIIFWLESKSPF